MILQRLYVLRDSVISAIEVVVHVDEVVAALVAAGFDEAFKVAEAVEGVNAVRYGGCSQLDLTPVGLDVALVDGDAVGDIEVGFACVVWLVGSV